MIQERAIKDHRRIDAGGVLHCRNIKSGAKQRHGEWTEGSCLKQDVSLSGLVGWVGAGHSSKLRSTYSNVAGGPGDSGCRGCLGVQWVPAQVAMLKPFPASTLLSVQLAKKHLSSARPKNQQ